MGRATRRRVFENVLSISIPGLIRKDVQEGQGICETEEIRGVFQEFRGGNGFVNARLQRFPIKKRGKVYPTWSDARAENGLTCLTMFDASLGPQGVVRPHGDLSRWLAGPIFAIPRRSDRKSGQRTTRPIPTGREPSPVGGSQAQSAGADCRWQNWPQSG